MLDYIPIILILGWIVLYYKVREVFAPWSIMLLVWIAVVSAYAYLDHGLYKTSDDFSPAILLWCSSFSIVGYIVYRLTPANTSPEWETNQTIVKFFTILALIITPVALYKAASFALSSGTDNLMYTMRDQVIDKDSGFSLGPIMYFVHVVYTLLIVSADAEKHWNKWFFLLCLGINLLFFFIIMSKLVLFIGILSTLYLCYVHKRIKLRTIGITMIAFVIIALLFTQTRATSSGDTDDTFTFAELLAMYLLSPIPAFGLENPCSSPIWGYETFRPVYNILSGLGLYHGQLFDLGRVFVAVPIPTNVFTTMSPYYNDFGLQGIAVLGAIEGGIISFIYKKGSTGHTLARNLYAFLTAGIALQYFDDQFYLAISNILQMAVLIFIFHIKPVWKPDQKFLIKQS